MATLDLSPALEVSTDSPSAALHDPLLGGHVVAELLGDFAKNLHQNEAWKMTHTSYIYNIYIYITIISIIYIYIILHMYIYYIIYVLLLLIIILYYIYYYIHIILLYIIYYITYISIYIYIDYILYLVYYISYIIYIYLLYCIVYTYFCFHDFRWGFSESNCWRNHKSHPSFSSLTLDTLQETCDVWCSKQPRNMAATSYSELV